MTAASASRTFRPALAVFVLALVLRAGFVLLQGAPAPLAGDAAEYRAYASSLASTGRFVGPKGARATRMPGYPVFLAALETVAGPSTRAVQWTQCLLGAFACLFIFLWAGSLLRPPWALACGLAAACYYDLVAPSSWTLTECLYSFSLAASFCVLFREALPVRRRALLGGLCFGLTSLVRPEVLPFAVLILGASPFLFKGFARKHAALALAAFIGVGSLWVGRNALVLRRFVPASSTGSFNLYCGLRLPLDRQGLDLGPMPAPSDAGEFERDAAFRRAYVALRGSVSAARRAKAYLFNLLTVYYPFLPQYDWTYALLVPFWLYGLWLARARRELRPAAGLVAGLSVVFAFLAGPVSRYRFGFAPCLILLAGAGAQGLQDRMRGSRRFYWMTSGWAAANVAVWLAAGELRHAVLGLKAHFWGG